MVIYMRGVKHTHKYYAANKLTYTTDTYYGTWYPGYCLLDHTYCIVAEKTLYKYSLQKTNKYTGLKPPLYIRQKRHTHTYEKLSSSYSNKSIAIKELESCPLGHSNCRMHIGVYVRKLYLNKSTGTSNEWKASVPIRMRRKVWHSHNLDDADAGLSTTTSYDYEPVACPKGHSNCVMTNPTPITVYSHVYISNKITDNAYG